MKIKLPLRGLLTCVVLVSSLMTAQFPYNLTFNSSTAPVGVILPPGQDTNSATFTDDGLQLTPNLNGRFGAVVLNNVSFSPANGIDIEFDYAMYGNTSINDAADGISFFLFDAAVSPTIGSDGAALGYSYNRTNSRPDYITNSRRRGLIGAYLGVGFDFYGNYKTRRFQPDSRVNGVTAPTNEFIGMDGKSHITIRGAAGTTLNTTPIPGTQFGGTLAVNGYGNNYFGYPVLVSASTISNGANSKATLNPLTGAYQFGNSVSAVSVRQGTAGLPAANTRRGIIELRPHQEGGFNVTVKLKVNNTVHVIIDKYHYPLSFKYTENANNNDLATGMLGTDTGNGAQASTVHTLNAPVPTTLKMGFAASTGGFAQVHLIRSVSVNLPFRSEPTDDNLSICVGETREFDPLANDKAYGGLITNPTYSQANIDKNSFRFTNANGDNLGTTLTTSRGTYTYNASTGKVTFVPLASFVSGADEIMYSLKGLESPYNTELYRMPAKIVVTSRGVVPRPSLSNLTSPTSANPNGTFLINSYNSALYSYSISPSTGVSVSSTGVVTAPAGTYIVSATNSSNGCVSATSAITLSDPTVNISLVKTNSQSLYYRPSTSTYTMRVKNEGSAAVNNLLIKDSTPANFGTADFNWIATATAGSSIRLSSDSGLGSSSISGSGSISHLANLQPGGEITYTVTLRISDEKRGPISNTLSIEVPGGLLNTNPTGNSVTDTDQPGIDARNDSFANSAINSTVGGVAGVLSANDLLNDASITNTSLINFQIINNGGITGASISPNGNLNIPSGVSAGVYTMTYRICEVANPSNCDSATVIVEVFTDSDGDGISDVVDLDDDNDGILDTEEQNACGDQIISYFKEDFGAGSRTSFAGLGTSATTNYIYQGNNFTVATATTSNINDGMYALLSNTENISSWASTPPDANGRAWIITNDHTSNDGIGRMALFNASRSTSEQFFNVQNITGLPANTTVKLSFWAINLDIKSGSMNAYWDRNRSLPNIRVKILGDGTTLLKEATSGTIPRDEAWHQYTMYFNTGNSGSVSFVMYNDMEGGLGNDLALDDILITSICDTDGDGIPNELDLDSDNDGCLDAIEGGDNVSEAMLVNATAALSVGVGSSAPNKTLCISSSCVDVNGVPVVVNPGGGADVDNQIGQSADLAYNSLMSGCICYVAPTNTTANVSSKHGITLLQRAAEGSTNWPMNRNSAHTVLESNTKGFVITRLETSQFSQIQNPVDGMMVYDITAQCLKIYADGNWSCFSTPACP